MRRQSQAQALMSLFGGTPGLNARSNHGLRRGGTMCVTTPSGKDLSCRGGLQVTTGHNDDQDDQDDQTVATGGASTGDGPFDATVQHDPAINSTVILLSYRDHARPARSITVGIAPELGSNMFQLRVGEHELIHCEPALLRRMDFTGNFVLWPLPNRVRDKRYTYQGHTYSLADVERPQGNDVLIHGLVFDQPWQYDQPVVAPDLVRVRTHIDITPASPHYGAYPFASRLTLTYTLTADGVTVAYEVENKGVTDLPFGFALHPYFATLSGAADTTVSIPATRVMEADGDLLPTGRVLDVEGVMYSMFDLRQPAPVGALKLDHVYTGLLPGQDAVIAYGTRGLRLHLSACDDFTHMVIYTLGGEAFFCLENQTCATDAVNLYAQGRQDIAHLRQVRPGDAAAGSIRYTVEHEG